MVSAWTCVIWMCLFSIGSCIEEYQREIYLAPRNFNPHPYEHQLAKIQNPGPVVFPTGEESQIGNQYNIITIDDRRVKLQPVNPYNQLKQKVKFLIERRYGSKENEIDNDVVYDALARQGAKVLRYPPQELQHYTSDNLVPRNNYAFAYKVLDKATGDDFSHQQIRSSKATNGEYRVKLPDGRLQIVSYKADKDGYKADVRYEIDPEAQQQQHHHYQPQPVPQKYVPVNYQYYPEEISQHSVVSTTQGPPVSYVTPNPQYYTLAPQVPHQPNIQIYTSNPREQISHISTTIATPVTHHSRPQYVRYTATPVPPTVKAHIISNADRGLFNPNLVSSHGQKNVINTLASHNPSDGYRQQLEQENELPEGIYIVGKTGKK